jgi:hypothetical protein
LISQQIAEFLASVLSPFRAARSIDAIREIVGAANFLPPATSAALRPFVGRIFARGEALRNAGISDLQGHLEEFIARFSYEAAVWLTLSMKDRATIARYDSVDASLGQALRERIRDKLARAQSFGARLLERCAQVEAQSLTGSEIDRFVEELTSDNAQVVEEDEQEEKAFTVAAVDKLAANLGLPTIGDSWNPGKDMQDFLGKLGLPVQKSAFQEAREALATAVKITYGRMYDVQRSYNPRRRMLAQLFFGRGRYSITKPAFDLVKDGKVKDGAVPESVEEALQNPTSHTIESFLWLERLHGRPVGDVQSWRRCGAPYFQAGAPK